MPPSDPAAVPPRTSCCQHLSDCAQHNAPAEPAGPCDCGKGGPPCGAEPVPPPEWAVEMAFAHTFPADYRSYGYAVARGMWAHLEGTADWRGLDRLARLLASVREAAIRQAARVAYKKSNTSVDDEASWYLDDVGDDILSLLHTPQSGGAG